MRRSTRPPNRNRYGRPRAGTSPPHRCRALTVRSARTGRIAGTTGAWVRDADGPVHRWRVARRERRRSLRRARPRHGGGHRQRGQRRGRRCAGGGRGRGRRPAALGSSGPRASAPRSCGGAWELLTERADDLARLITLENGKVLAEAKGEITYAAEFFRWFSEEAVRLRGELSTAPAGTNRILVLHQPVGVAFLVTPWNFPAAMATRKIAPALAAGCAVVLKPATLTPLTALGGGRRAPRGGRPGRGRQRRPRHECQHHHRRGAGAPAGAQALVHRVHRGGEEAAGAGRRPRAEHVDGAGRQRALHRAGRRRPRRRRRRRHDRQDAPQR